MPKDFKNKKLNKQQLELANVLRYLDERMLNLSVQIRSVILMEAELHNLTKDQAAKMWHKNFIDDKAQDDLFVQLHVAEDLYEAEERVKAQKEQEKVTITEEEHAQ